MPIDAERRTYLLQEATSVAGSARSLPGVLEALASVLTDDVTLSRISLRTLDTAEGRLAVRGVWSSEPTAIGPGVSLPIGSTSFAQVERAGRSVRSKTEGADVQPLLDRVIHDEGNRTWVLVPLWREGAIVAILSLSSPDEAAFDDGDLGFFDGLGTAIQARVLELAGLPAAPS